MSKLYAISGTHGCGKTTLLNELKSSIPSLIVDDFKVARAVQVKLKADNLSAVTKTPTQIMKFQELVFETKLEHDSKLIENNPENSIILVERSFIDIIAYAKLWISTTKKVTAKHRDWLKDFKSRCMKAQAIYDGHIMVHAHPDIPFEVDPNRATEETRDQFEQIMIEEQIFTQSISRAQIDYSYDSIAIFSAPIEDRVNAVKTFLQHHIQTS